MTRNSTECQRELIRLGFLMPGEDDGIFGQRSLDAFNHFLASKGRPPVTAREFTLLDVNEALWPSPPKPQATPSIFDQIGTLVSLANLLKGKTMTNDQLAGLVRTVLAVGLTWLAGKGIIPAVPPDLLATLTLAIVGIWSWVSNRPKTITKIGQ